MQLSPSNKSIFRVKDLKQSELAERHYGAIEDDCNCGLLAVSDVLALSGVKISYELLRSRYFDLGFPIYDFGLSAVHVALLLQSYGFGITLKTPSKWLKDIFDSRRMASAAHVILSQESTHTREAMDLLICRGGHIEFASGKRRPNIKSILQSFEDNCIRIVCVNARDYYGINEDWNHYVVIIHDSSEHSLVLVDSLQHFGRKYYSDWDRHFRKAREYDWTQWSGDIMIVRQLMAELGE